MLHDRQPLYSKHFLNPGLAKLQERHLFQDQYQTRRDTFLQLEKARKLFESNNLSELLEYVEEIMSNYYPIKTHRVFPRKFEFMCDIYNMVGVAYIKSLHIPAYLKLVPLEHQLHLLLDIPIDEKFSIIRPVFGDKSTFKDPTAPDFSYIKMKKECDHYEERNLFAEYPIEKCYLYHERARLNVKMTKLDESRILGRKIIDEESGDNQVWKFLGALMMIRANVAQSNVEKNLIDMPEASKIAKKLDENCEHFVQLLIHLNNELIKKKMAAQKLIEQD